MPDAYLVLSYLITTVDIRKQNLIELEASLSMLSVENGRFGFAYLTSADPWSSVNLKWIDRILGRYKL